MVAVQAGVLQPRRLVGFTVVAEPDLRHLIVLEPVAAVQFVSLHPEIHVNFHLPMWVVLQHLLALWRLRHREHTHGLPHLGLHQFPLLQLVVGVVQVNTFAVPVAAVVVVAVLGIEIIFPSHPEQVTQLLLERREQGVEPTGLPEARLHSMA